MTPYSTTGKHQILPKINTEETTVTPHCDSTANAIVTDILIRRTPALSTGKGAIESSPLKSIHQAVVDSSVTLNDSVGSTASKNGDSMACHNHKNGNMSESPRKKQPGGWLTKKERDAMRPKYDIDDLPDDSSPNQCNGGWEKMTMQIRLECAKSTR
jgi:hypothetical protein